MLTQDLAKEIVEQTMVRLNRNINLMNEEGLIIASGNKNRINQIHAGAVEVLRTGKPLIITKNAIEHWRGSLPGINLPIKFQDNIIGVIGITGEPDTIMEFGELVKMITEMMIQQHFIAEQLEWKQLIKEQIFEELLKEMYKEETIIQKLNMIKANLQSPFQVALIDINHNHLNKRDLLQILFNGIFNEEQTLVGFLNVNRIFILTSNLQEKNIKQKLEVIFTKLTMKNISSRIGLGTPVIDFTQIRHSYLEAQKALKLGSVKQHLIAYTEIETIALLTGLDERSRLQYLNRVIGNLPNKLVITLENFFTHNQNIGECAKTMYIHRNSLIYRLKKIKELTGYDPQIFNDAITLRLAVWLLQLSGWPDSENTQPFINR